MIFRNAFFLSVSCSVLLAFGSCGTDTPPKTTQTVQTATDTPDAVARTTPETQHAAVAPEVVAPAPQISYHPYSLRDTGYKAFKTVFTKEQQRIILALNRIDASHLGRKDSLVVPDTFMTDFLLYAPYPQSLPQAKDIRKMVLFSYPVQAFAAYENGRLVRWGPTSMGKKSTPTPTGLFFANWKALETHSTVDPSWVLKWNFNVSNKGGVGWHLYDLPGYPASHSCMRLLKEDAQWLYDWASMWIVDRASDQLLAQGTPTIIFGSYPWGQARPWKGLLTDGAANAIPADTLRTLLDAYVPRILAKQTQRDSVVAARGETQSAPAVVQGNVAP
ncbi:MAG: murein L,D-transpeptidase [Sphingobacteriales bacterium]|nr:MAG: murein L,D-transpeptidase [Sphingobacteriales bacterium]